MCHGTVPRRRGEAMKEDSPFSALRRLRNRCADLHLLPALTTALVFGLAAFVLFHNLGGTFIEDWDEGVFLSAVQRTLKSHDYLAIRLEDVGPWDKSPFPLYPMLLSVKVFGMNEAAARAPSALFGMGIVALVFLIARRFYGLWTGLLAVVVTVTTTQLVFHHGLRSANIESITLFFLTGALASWLLIHRTAPRVLITAASLAAAFLCKGPIIGIPVAAIGLSLLVENPLKGKFLRYCVLSAILFVLLAAPWYLYMYGRFGQEFLEKHVARVIFGWFAKGSGGHIYGDTFYLRQVFFSPAMLPWYGAAVIALIYFFRLFSEKRRLAEGLLIIWVITTFVVIHAAQTKLYWYVFPLYPPLAIMIAKTLADFVEKRDYLNATAAYAGLTVVLTLFFDLQVFPSGRGSGLAKAVLAAALAWGAVTLVSRQRPRARQVLCGLLVAVLCYVPAKLTVERTFKGDASAPIFPVAEAADPTKPIYTYQLGRPAAVYYLAMRSEVRELYSNLEELRGNQLVVRSDLLAEAKSAEPDGSFSLLWNGLRFRFVPVKSANGFTLLKVE